MALKFCPYCGYEKDDSEFTDEHVLPQAIGGNLNPTNPFLIRVCGSCNVACGRWIDGRFIRSWPIHHARAASHSRLFGTGPQVLPLRFMGRVGDWPAPDDTVCDFWIGPTGDHVYHFHKAYADSEVFAGRPPHVRAADLDPGRVFLKFVASNPVWPEIVYASVKDAFALGTPIHILNGAPQGHSAPYPTPPAEAAEQLKWIVSRPDDKELQVSVAIDGDFGVRFLVKCALGLGTAVMGELYSLSGHASELRAALWERDSKARSRFSVRGSSFLGAHEDTLDDLLRFRDCHVLTLIPVKSSLFMRLVLYGTVKAVIEISNEPAIWSPMIPRDGVVWVVFPPLGRHSGMITLPDYLSAATSGSPSATRSLLDEVIVAGEELPPFHLVPVAEA